MGGALCINLEALDTRAIGEEYKPLQSQVVSGIPETDNVHDSGDLRAKAQATSLTSLKLQDIIGLESEDTYDKRNKT